MMVRTRSNSYTLGYQKDNDSRFSKRKFSKREILKVFIFTRIVSGEKANFDQQ